MLFHIEDDSLTIKLQGLEIFWALRRRLVIPKSAVTNVSWHAHYRADASMLRMGGTDLPGALDAGTFRSSEGWQFLYLNRARGWPLRKNSLSADNVLVIDLQNMRYKRLLLTCPEPMAEEIKLWWTGRTHRKS